MGMNLVDVIIIIGAIAAAVRGYKVGLLRQVLAFSGFTTGLLLGIWLAPFLLPQAAASRLLFALGLAVMLAAAVAAVAEVAAVLLQARIHVRVADMANRILGAGAGIIFVVIASWLLSAAILRLPVADVSLAVEKSTVAAVITRLLPTAPDIASRLNELAGSYGYPEIYSDAEPPPDQAGPAVTPAVNAAAQQAQASTVRIESLACGGIITGSGFVAAPAYVVTNAHVVAGADRPVIMNQGRRQPADIVWFDASLDFAVLRTGDSLPGKPLALADRLQPRGTSGAVLGYPGGGPLTVSPSVVLRSQLAIGRDIYGRSLSSREIYALQTDVTQGNSGGPLVLPDGRVAGVIFGESVGRDGVGYALTSSAVADDLRTALTKKTAVDSGRCL